MNPLSSEVCTLAFVEAKSSKTELHVPYCTSVIVFAPCNLSTVSQVADTQAQSRPLWCFSLVRRYAIPKEPRQTLTIHTCDSNNWRDSHLDTQIPSTKLGISPVLGSSMLGLGSTAVNDALLRPWWNSEVWKSSTSITPIGGYPLSQIVTAAPIQASYLRHSAGIVKARSSHKAESSENLNNTYSNRGHFIPQVTESTQSQHDYTAWVIFSDRSSSITAR